MNQFPYGEATETMMKRLFNNLSEKDRRHYASIEAAKLEHGGITYLSRPELLTKLKGAGIHTSLYHVDKLLGKLGLGRRKMEKTGTFKQVEGRNEQFENIERLVANARQAGHIIISMDSKKKELLGQLYRPGKTYCNVAQVCNDHDFASQATGKVAPFGIYDIQLNEGYMFLGQSADTPDFAVDCLHEYIRHYAFQRHPETTDMLILCDAGARPQRNS